MRVIVIVVASNPNATFNSSILSQCHVRMQIRRVDEGQ